MNFRPGLVPRLCWLPTEENSQAPNSSLHLSFPNSTLHDSWKGHNYYLTSNPLLILVLEFLMRLCRLWIVSLCSYPIVFTVLISSQSGCCVLLWNLAIPRSSRWYMGLYQGLHHILFLYVLLAVVTGSPFPFRKLYIVIFDLHLLLLAQGSHTTSK